MARLSHEERAELSRWLEEQRRAIKKQRKSGRVAPELIEQLGHRYQELEDRYCNEEALEVIEVAFEGLRYVKQPKANQSLSYRAWRSKALTSGWLGRYGETIEGYEKAVALGEKGAYANEKPQFDPGNRRELGSYYWRVGDLSEALRNLSIAEDKLEKSRVSVLPEPDYRDELARLRAAFGLAYLDLGRYEDAAKSAAEAARIHEELGKTDLKRNLQAAIDYTTLGNARREVALEREADLDDAFGAFDEALRVLGKVPSVDQEYTDRESDIYLGRGHTLLFRGEHEKALDDLERSLSLASEMNVAQHAAAHQLYIGQSQATLKRIADAEESLEKAAEMAERYGTPETRWRALYELAVVREADGRKSEAKEALAECISTIEGLRSQYLPEPFKISMLGAKEKAYEAMVKNLFDSAVEATGVEAARKAEEAFGYAERAKSRVFAEQLATTDLGSLADIPAKLLSEERELTRKLRILRADHLERLARGTYDWGKESRKVEARLGKIRERMRGSTRGEEYVSLREAATLDYSGVRALIADGGGTDGTGDPERGTGQMILIEYFVTEEEVFVFVGRSDLEAPRLHRIPLSREGLRDWAFAIENTDAEDLEFWDLERWQLELGPLVDPLEEWSEEGDLVWIVPHAELHLLPLHALKVEGRYLAERNPVVYSASASVMPYCKAKRAGGGKEALVLGDSLPPPNNLTHAREEAEAVARLFGIEPMLGVRASKRMLEEKLRELRGELSVLHIACHGKFDYSEPLKSRIRLAPLDGKGSVNGTPDLSAEEILVLEIEADLVVLSACASGVSGRRAGDELIGLTRSLLYAGAPSLVVGLWYVSDSSTRLLMERFYGALLARDGDHENVNAPAGKARVLQRAQRHIMRIEGFEHPYFWAPFVLVGDWR